MNDQSAQIALDRVHEVSRRLCALVPLITSRIQKVSVTNGLRDLRKLSEKLFSSGGDAFLEVLTDLAEVERVLAALEKKVPPPASDATANVSGPRRCELLDCEEFQTCDSSSDSALAEAAAGVVRTVDAVVADVRAWESSWAVQLALWSEKRHLGSSMQRSADQFTYGSTSLGLWVQLAHCPAWVRMVQRRLRALNGAEEEQGRVEEGGEARLKACVFGSSQGLLLFYTHALLSLQVMAARVTGGGRGAEVPVSVSVCGFEVMRCLHAKADQLATEHGCRQQTQAQDRGDGSAWQAGISSRLSDMMRAPLAGSGVDVVVLTSLCWDLATRNEVGRKLHRELVVGSLVVDYTADLFRNAGVDADHCIVAPRSAAGNTGGGDSSSASSSDGGSSGSSAAPDEMLGMLSAALAEKQTHPSAPPAAPTAALDNLERLLAAQLQGAILANFAAAGAGAAATDTGASVANAKEPRAGGGVLFKLRHILVGECTWNSEQKLFVFEAVAAHGLL